MNGWPVLKITLRAGLLAAILCLFVAFAAAAPVPIVPGNCSSLSYRAVPVSSQSIQNAIVSSNVLNNVPPSQLYLAPSTEVVREETEVLVRRSILSKLKAWGHRVKEKFKAAGQKIKQGFQTFAHKAKEGFQKVRKFIVDTGAKIAKFGLKVIATVTKCVAKVIGFIPGIGKAVGKAVEGVSTLANLASNKIKAKLSPKLESAMAKMDKARKIVGYIP